MRTTPEASKAALAEAAERVLLEAGLNGLSLDRVAREAGCAKGLVNYHFRTKGDLLAAVAARLAARRRERLLTAAQGVGAAALDGLWDSVRKAAASGESARITAERSLSRRTVSRTTSPGRIVSVPEGSPADAVWAAAGPTAHKERMRAAADIKCLGTIREGTRASGGDQAARLLAVFTRR